MPSVPVDPRRLDFLSEAGRTERERQTSPAGMSDLVHEKVAGWSVEGHLAFDIGFALPRSPIKVRRALSEEERRAIAMSVVEHLKLCGWKFQMTPIAGHGTGNGG